MLLLLSSDPKSNFSKRFSSIYQNPLGQAFIETKNLDGETNLKHKSVPKGIAKGYKGTNEEVICINFHLSDSDLV